MTAENKQRINFDEFDPAAAAKLAVDQVVVDGLVNGIEQRVPFGTLLGISFQGQRAPASVHNGFINGLANDKRYLDRVRENKGSWQYAYEPTIEGDSTVKARPEAIVAARGIYSEEERTTAMKRMGFYADIVCQALQGPGQKPTVGLRIVQKALHVSGGISLDYDEFKGFLEYMKLDGSRLRLLEDGNVFIGKTAVAGRADAPLPQTPNPTPDASQPLETLLQNAFGGSKDKWHRRQRKH
jgi:hypothetical protein